MQRYEIKPEEQRIIGKILADFLGFLKYKIESGSLTMEEQQALLGIIERSVPVRGTCEDFAGYYGQSPVNIRSVINRKLLSKPLRRVTYPFLEFNRVAPEKWKK